MVNSQIAAVVLQEICRENMENFESLQRKKTNVNFKINHRNLISKLILIWIVTVSKYLNAKALESSLSKHFLFFLCAFNTFSRFFNTFSSLSFFIEFAALKLRNINDSLSVWCSKCSSPRENFIKLTTTTRALCTKITHFPAENREFSFFYSTCSLVYVAVEIRKGFFCYVKKKVQREFSFCVLSLCCKFKTCA